jgi:hypothetical protein
LPMFCDSACRRCGSIAPASPRDPILRNPRRVWPSQKASPLLDEIVSMDQTEMDPYPTANGRGFLSCHCHEKVAFGVGALVGLG